MDYQQFQSKILVRLDKGDEVVNSVKEIAQTLGIKLAAVSGIGALNHAVVGLFEQDSKEYHTREFAGSMEITGLMGNISEKDGEVYLHLHITLSDSELRAFGGHLSQGIVGATAEIIIDVIDGKVNRKMNEEVGLNIFQFAN